MECHVDVVGPRGVPVARVRVERRLGERESAVVPAQLSGGRFFNECHHVHRVDGQLVEPGAEREIDSLLEPRSGALRVARRAPGSPALQQVANARLWRGAGELRLDLIEQRMRVGEARPQAVAAGNLRLQRKRVVAPSRFQLLAKHRFGARRVGKVP